jgi:periplasmic copper chaperone A
MAMFPRYSGVLMASTIMLGLASCGKPPELKVNDAVVFLNPVDSAPSALYFTVSGGMKDVRLMRVVSPSVIRTEMHESKKDAATGAMTMAAMNEVPIPAKGKVEFKRGGKHVMMWGVNLKARRLGEMVTEYVFSNGDRILVDAEVKEMDGSIPDERKAAI